jgi:hypothetical protein
MQDNFLEAVPKIKSEFRLVICLQLIDFHANDCFRHSSVGISPIFRVISIVVY